MKSSEILREAAQFVENGGHGLFAAVQSSCRSVAIGVAIGRVLPEEYTFSPLELPQDVRATILCLAAAIAESEGE